MNCGTPKIVTKASGIDENLADQIDDKKISIEDARVEFEKFINDNKDSIEGNPEIIVGAIFDSIENLREIDPDWFTEENIKNIILGKDTSVDSAKGTTEDTPDSDRYVSLKESATQFIDNAYMYANQLKEYVERRNMETLYNALFFNKGMFDTPKGCVTSTSVLNKNIRSYLEKLFNDIITYLKYKIELKLKENPEDLSLIYELDTLNNTKLYVINDQGNLVNSHKFYYLKGLMRTEFNDLYGNTEKLNALFNATDKESKLLLEAFNACVFLPNFDDAVISCTSKSIEIFDHNILTGRDNKYRVSDSTASVYTTWRTKESIDVSKEADLITKMGIQCTPLLEWQTNNQISGKYLSFNDFNHLIAKIKKLLFYVNPKLTLHNIKFDAFYQGNDLFQSLSPKTQELIKNKSMHEVIACIRFNARAYVPVVFELLSHPDFINNHNFGNVFSIDEKNKMYSFYKLWCDPNSDSIFALSNPKEKVDYFAYMTQLADSIFDVTLVLYYHGEDGLLTTRTLMDASIYNIRKGIEFAIDVNNSPLLITDKEKFEASYTAEEKSDNSKKNNEDKKIPTKLEYNLDELGFKAEYVLSSGSVTYYKDGKKVYDFSKLYENESFLRFIDRVLNIGISTDKTFREYLLSVYTNRGEVCQKLLDMATRVLGNKYISYKYVSNAKPWNKENEANKIFGTNTPRYNYQLEEMGLIHGSDFPILLSIAMCKANRDGLITSSVIRDGNGNMLNKTTLSRLLGNVHSQWDLLERLSDSITKDCLLLKYPELLAGVDYAKELKQSDGALSTMEMTATEMAYLGFISDYVGGLLAEDTDKYKVFKNGIIGILPSVNSDKKDQDRLRINTNVEINGKKLRDYTIDEMRNLISKEMGTIYKGMISKITEDWKLVLALISVNPILHSAPNLNWASGFAEFNEWFSKSPEAINTYGNPVNCIKTLVRQHNTIHRTNTIILTDLIHFISDKGGKLGINKTIPALLARFNPRACKEYGINYKEYPSIKDFWRQKEADIIKNLTRIKFNVDLTSDSKENKYIRDNYPEWVSSSGTLVYAKLKLKSGNVVNITSRLDFIKLGILPENIYDNIDHFCHNGSLELNPLISQYNNLDFLITEEWMINTVGSFLAHPHKSKSDNIFDQEAGHINSQNKRNVSFTAAMHAFQLGQLHGIPYQYNIAILDDIEDFQGTIIGDINKIKPWDGATFVNPFIVYLENNSLEGASAGIHKKLYVHFVNPKTGTGGLIKTAGFGLTNNWIRTSPFLQRMMWRMTNHQWIDANGTPIDIDITKDFTGKPIAYVNESTDNFNHRPLFYTENGKFYKITNIQYNGSNSYTKSVCEVDEYGNEISENNISRVTVNTNYKLWKLFGGANSLEIDLTDKKLVPSEMSIKCVVKAMNSIGIVKEGVDPENVEYQDLHIYQVLKHSDIHYIPTAGAVKLGAANVNTDERYYDLSDFSDVDEFGNEIIEDDCPLDFMLIDMYQSGIQLDKEHHADNAELSLMTLVISACAAKGYTFDQATALYEALSNTGLHNMKDFIDALSEYFASNSLENFQEILVKTIVDNIDNKRTTILNFASIIANSLIKDAKKGSDDFKYSELAIPLSDNTIYAKVILIINTYMTNSGIRQKIKGILAVLTPSHGIMKIHGGRKYDSFTNPKLELTELQLRLVPVYSEWHNMYTLGLKEFKNFKVNYVNNLYNADDVKVPFTSDSNSITLDPNHIAELFNNPALLIKNNIPNIFNNREDLFRYILIQESIKLNHGVLDPVTLLKETLKSYKNRINTIELGRTYKVKRVVEILDELPDGTIITGYDTQEFSELIATPADYRRLKQDIENDLISEITEDVIVGRDLAAYNVRFEDSKGRSYQMYDLDSYNQIYELSETLGKLKKAKTDQDKIDIIKEYFGDSILYPELLTEEAFKLFIDIQTEKLKELGRFAHRQLQRDLMNLSPNCESAISLYDRMMNDPRFEDPIKWAQWVNIQLQTGDGNKINYNGLLTEVNAENFQLLKEYVRNLMIQNSTILINGEYVEINAESLDILPYELIMPKTFATNFGLNQFSDLNEIANNKDYFILLYIDNQRSKVYNEKQYDVELKVSTGNHYYLLEKDNLPFAGREMNEVIIRIKRENGKIYRLDSKDNVMYEMLPNDKIYITEQGLEIIVTNDINFYAENLHYDGIHLSNNLINLNITEDDKIFSKSLKYLRLWQKSDKKQLNRFANDLLANGRNAINIREANNIKITKDNYKELGKNSWIIEQGREKHSSFLLYLETIAARIPAQGMQSFMPMKIVAFDNPDINNAYVSTMQILLLGSDFDIDCVSIATYDIDRNGKLQLWSPYANMQSIELLKESKNLPVPTGRDIKVKKDDLQSAILFIGKYKDLFNISLITDFKQSKKGEIKNKINPNELQVNLNIETTEDIKLLSEFLKESTLYIVDEQNYTLFAEALKLLEILPDYTLTNNQIQILFDKLEKIINKHNHYFDKVSQYNISKIMNNHIIHSMYTIGADPANLPQAHSSVDVITIPLKNIANSEEKIKDARHRGCQTFLNKYLGIFENQVGAQGIGICAVGMKGFLAWTQSNNEILNSGNTERQSRILLGRKNDKGEYEGITIAGRTYYTLANIRAMDPSTITNDDVLKALSQVDNDEDQVLVLSALLSLATDNAKELALDKLNASTKILGMYLYAVSIGMKFQDIANILMSSTALMVNEVTERNSFRDKQGANRVNYRTFKYFKNGPDLLKYNIKRIKNHTIVNPLEFLILQLPKTISYKKDDEKKTPVTDVETLLVLLGSDINLSISLKLLKLEALRSTYKDYNGTALFNLLIDFCQEYVYQRHTINPDILKDIQKLSEGAEEMFVFGRILSINQGLKTDKIEFISLLSAIERCIYDRKRDPIPKDIFSNGDLIDIIKLIHNPKYRDQFKDIEIDLDRLQNDEKYLEEIHKEYYVNIDWYLNDYSYQDCAIWKYEKVKHTLNIIENVLNVPNFKTYLATMAYAKQANMRSFKFRSILNMTIATKKYMGVHDDISINKGLENFISDFIYKEFIKQSKYKEFTIPKGSKAFTKYGDIFELEVDTKIDLSTNWGMATFMMWVRDNVIPELKQSNDVRISLNDFIRDIGYNMNTHTVSSNAMILQTLPIRMMPRNDSEATLINGYIDAFNKLKSMYYKGIPLENIFVLYSMISNRWKLDEKSLVPIFRDSYDSGIIKEFNEFQAKLDRSSMVLKLKDKYVADKKDGTVEIFKNNIIPYVAVYESPKTARAKYIWTRDFYSKKMRLMRLLSDRELNPEKYMSEEEKEAMESAGIEDILEDVAQENTRKSNWDKTRIGNYLYVDTNRKIDRNLFTTGSVDIPIEQTYFTIDGKHYVVGWSMDRRIQFIKSSENKEDIESDEKVSKLTNIKDTFFKKFKENLEKELKEKLKDDEKVKEERRKIMKSTFFVISNNKITLNNEVLEAFIKDTLNPC